MKLGRGERFSVRVEPWLLLSATTSHGWTDFTRRGEPGRDGAGRVDHAEGRVLPLPPAARVRVRSRGLSSNDPRLRRRPLWNPHCRLLWLRTRWWLQRQVSGRKTEKNEDYSLLSLNRNFAQRGLFALRRSREMFLCRRFLTSLALCEVLAIVASPWADTTTPKTTINRFDLRRSKGKIAIRMIWTLMRLFYALPTGGGAAGRPGDRWRRRGGEDPGGFAPPPPQPFSHRAPPGEPAQSPETLQQSLGDRRRQHQGSLPPRTGQ